MINFLFPERLFLLPFLVLVFSVLVFITWRHEQEVLTSFRLSAKKTVFITELIIIFFAVLFLVLTLARPYIVSKERYKIRFTDDTALLMVFDVSLSMLAQEKPYADTRLDRAKKMAQEILKYTEVKTGICGFTDNLMAHLLPTADLASVMEVLNQTVVIASVPFGYYKQGRLEAIAEQYSNFFPENQKNKIIIVFTDGDMPAPKETSSLREKGVIVFLVGIGSQKERIYDYDENGKLIGPRPVAINFRKEILKKTANMFGGYYISEEDIDSIIRELKKNVGKEGMVEETALAHKIVELTPLTTLATFAMLMVFLYLRRPR